MWNCCRNEAKRIGHISSGKFGKKAAHRQMLCKYFWWNSFFHTVLCMFCSLFCSFLCIPFAEVASNAIRKVGDRIRAKRGNHIQHQYLDVRRLGYDDSKYMGSLILMFTFSLRTSYFPLFYRIQAIHCDQSIMHFYTDINCIRIESEQVNAACIITLCILHFDFYFESKLCNSTYK